MTRLLCSLCAGWLCLGSVGAGTVRAAEESRFAMTHSRSQYVHWIDLYDAEDRRIDITDPEAPPYSPMHTCGRCHDYEAISHGYHFNAVSKQARAGRAGEPWIWTDQRSGTQIPLSYRGWRGTYQPEELGISRWDFVLKFGRHLPGGGVGTPAITSAEDEEAAAAAKPDEEPENDAEERGEEMAGRWPLSGELSIDCMFCHSNDNGYSPEVWWDQIQKQNFAWAPAAALGLINVDGEVSRTPDDDPSKLPKTTYRDLRTNAQNQVFFDIVRQPSNDACYYCHTTRVVGSGAVPEWTHDEDVHLEAGMSCSDCHRNGIEHHTVRGYEGEQHPTGTSIVTLTCRGCHMGDQSAAAEIPGGRLGAPKPIHRGLPALHLDRLSCTACHSGPRPAKESLQLQTAMAHELGLPTHHAGPDLAPGITGPVFMQQEGVLYPYRVVWPAFWGKMVGETITPLNPEEVYDAVRRVLRVRRGATLQETLAKDVEVSAAELAEALGENRADVPEEEWTEQEKAKIEQLEQSKLNDVFREKLTEALEKLQEELLDGQDQPVYVSAGRVYGLNAEGEVTEFEHDAASPYAWYLAHDVRPARWSTGAEPAGCYECHALGAPIFEGQVAALGPTPDPEPITREMYELAEYDKTRLDAWSLSFQGRAAFKWFAFVSTSIVGLVVLAFVVTGVHGLLGRRRRG